MLHTIRKALSIIFLVLFIYSFHIILVDIQTQSHVVNAKKKIIPVNCTEPLHKEQVDLIAPSSKGKAALEESKKYVADLNLYPHVSASIYNGNSPFYAAPDAYRAEDLIQALTDNSEIIWCIRGGMGAALLIPYLENLPKEQKEKIAQNKHKKTLIGFSDITVLHTYLQNKFDWQNIHATMPDLIVRDKVAPDSINKLMELIGGKQTSIVYHNLKQLSNGSKVTHLESKIIGGNMTLIRDTIGTPWQINPKNKILFLEDVNEQPHKIERTLVHFKQSGLLDGIDALIFGDFCDSGNTQLMEIVQKRFAKSVDFPVFTISGIGHDYISNPLPLNTHTTIQVENTKEGFFSIRIENIDLFKTKGIKCVYETRQI
jgi:muramoyltetrapeptide carboxypeptidase